MNDITPSDVFPTPEELEKVRKLVEIRDANDADCNLLVVATLITGKGGPVDRKYVLEVLRKASSIPLENILDGRNTGRFIELLEQDGDYAWDKLSRDFDKLSGSE